MATPDASSALRQRKTTKGEPAQDDDSPSRLEVSTEDRISISFLDVLRMLLGLLLLSTLLSYFITNTFFWSHTPPTITSQIARIRRYIRGPIYLTDAELARY